MTNSRMFDVYVERRLSRAIVTVRTATGEIISQFEVPGGGGYWWGKTRTTDDAVAHNEFDTTEIDKYIKTLEKEVVMTSK